MMDEEHDRFNYLDFYREIHEKDLMDRIIKEEMFCIVDEEKGGIVAYVLNGNEELIKMLNKAEGGKYGVVRRLEG